MRPRINRTGEAIFPATRRGKFIGDENRTGRLNVSTKHKDVPSWITAIGTITLVLLTLALVLIAVIQFMTGKATFADFWASATSLPHAAPAPPLQATTVPPVALRELIALRSTENLTWLQKTDREAQLHGKRVTLSGYLVSAEYPMRKVAIEISPTEDGKEKFLLWCDSVTKPTWSKLPKGTFVELQTTLWKPLLGELVGEHTQLVKTTPP
jgi:hypothetical protein